MNPSTKRFRHGTHAEAPRKNPNPTRIALALTLTLAGCGGLAQNGQYPASAETTSLPPVAPIIPSDTAGDTDGLKAIEPDPNFPDATNDMLPAAS